MEQGKVKVFIVDDYPPMRQSLRKLLELEKDLSVCGEASDVQEAYEGILASRPDVAIVDLILGKHTGLELLTRLGEHRQKLPVLVLSLLPESLNAETALNKGARGYIMKSESPDQILAALRQVVNGNIYLSPAMAVKLRQRGNHAQE